MAARSRHQVCCGPAPGWWAGARKSRRCFRCRSTTGRRSAGRRRRRGPRWSSTWPSFTARLFGLEAVRHDCYFGDVVATEPVHLEDADAAGRTAESGFVRVERHGGRPLGREVSLLTGASDLRELSVPEESASVGSPGRPSEVRLCACASTRDNARRFRWIRSASLRETNASQTKDSPRSSGRSRAEEGETRSRRKPRAWESRPRETALPPES